jgi:hypothetical protein
VVRHLFEASSQLFAGRDQLVSHHFRRDVAAVGPRLDDVVEHGPIVEGGPLRLEQQCTFAGGDVGAVESFQRGVELPFGGPESTERIQVGGEEVAAPDRDHPFRGELCQVSVGQIRRVDGQHLFASGRGIAGVERRADRCQGGDRRDETKSRSRTPDESGLAQNRTQASQHGLLHYLVHPLARHPANQQRACRANLWLIGARPVRVDKNLVAVGVKRPFSLHHPDRNARHLRRHLVC